MAKPNGNRIHQPGPPLDNDVRNDRQRQRRQACPTKGKRQKKGDRPAAIHKNQTVKPNTTNTNTKEK
jgi:hypothetical protein